MATQDDKPPAPQLEDVALFYEAVKGARPVKANRLLPPVKKPKPIPRQLLKDERQALADSLSDHYFPAHELESGEELLYLRDGQSPIILSKLRRGHWVVQASIDLHGLIADEARLYVSEFIADCKNEISDVCALFMAKAWVLKIVSPCSNINFAVG